MLATLKDAWSKIFTPKYQHGNKKEISIVIFGCNDFSKHLYDLLQPIKTINILSFIDNVKTVNEFCGKPVYSPGEFKLANLNNIPIVIASPHIMRKNLPVIDFESIYQFKRQVQEIVNEHTIENHLLHPAALVDFIPSDFSNKSILFGQQGSGITLLSRICEKIVEFYPDHFVTKNKTSLFLEKLCYEYTQCIHQIIPEAVYFANGFNFHMSSWKIGTTCAICSIENTRIEVYSFATRNHIIGPVYNYHQIPGQDYLDKLTLQNYNLFFSIRNPLDIILSFLNKENQINPDSGEINTEAFFAFSIKVIEQLKIWQPAIKNFTILSYDKLIKNPISEIQKIMDKLGVAPSTEIATQIWNNLAFKQLEAAPKNHFWQGGLDKWEKYFKQEHIAFLQAEGMEDILEQYGYLETLAKFRHYTSKLGKYDWRDHDKIELLEKLKLVETYFRLEDYDTNDFFKKIFGESECIIEDNFCIIGNKQDSVYKIKNAFNNFYANKIVNAGSYPGHRIA